MRSRVVVGFVVLVLLSLTTATQIGRAAGEKNYGYAVLGDSCGRPNAVGASTPVNKSNMEMACLSNNSGSLVWVSLPKKNATCKVSDQVWGSVRCVAGRWSDATPTFVGSMDNAMSELLRAIAWRNEDVQSAVGAPTAEGYAKNLFDHSVVERELAERLATSGIEVSVYKDRTYILTRESINRCARFIDPWTDSQRGVRTLRLESAVEIPCPNFGAPTSSELMQMKAVMVRLGNTWNLNRNWTQLRDAIDEINESEEWFDINWEGIYLGTSLSLDGALMFTLGGGCFEYANTNGIGSVTETWC